MKNSVAGIVNKFIMVAALSFSGIYRVSLILLSGIFFDEQTVDLAAETYLLLTLATSLFGLPLVSVFMGKSNEENYYMFFLVFVLSVFFVFACQYFYPGINSYGLLLCCLSSSLFEVIRQSVLNRKLYYKIALCYLISILFFIFSFFVDLGVYEYYALSFLCVSLYLLASCVYERFYFFSSINTEDVKAYFDFLWSSASSTSINYVVPLVVVYFLKSESAYSLTVLSALLSVVIFVPRLLLNEYFYEARSGVHDSSRFNTYKYKVDCYLVVVFLIVVPAVASFFSSGFIMSVYAASIIFSQLSLIYSIFFTVNEDVNFLRNVNVYSFVFLIVFSSAIYLLKVLELIDEHGFISCFVIVFLLYQFSKLTVSRYYFARREYVG